jgi:hypothetical protein
MLFFTSCSDDNNRVQAVAPTVATTSPNVSATSVARNKVITVNFSTEMDASSINTSTLQLNKQE